MDTNAKSPEAIRQINNLRERKGTLENERDKIKKQKRQFRIAAGLAGATCLILWLISTQVDGNWALFIKLLAAGNLFLGFIFMIASYADSFIEQENEIKRIDTEIDYLQKDPSDEGKAEQLFKAHQLELKKYYDLTLYQNKAIFYVGVACILVGFIFVGITLYFILRPSSSLTGTDKILISAVGTLSTFLSNFVGAIFLKMYSGTLKALTEFHGRLVTTHHLHFGNYLSTTIKDPLLRDQSLADMIGRMSERKSEG